MFAHFLVQQLVLEAKFQSLVFLNNAKKKINILMLDKLKKKKQYYKKKGKKEK